MVTVIRMSSHPLTLYRKSRGLSKTGLARLLGTSRANITRWENDNRKPDKDSLRAICEATGIPAWELRPDLVDLIGGGARGVGPARS